ncbi:hypothetical protein Zmor_027270 [Zophobas morio]|uniref:Uncharacterized protein n=1 Tax=Zophobas morio TaxID=2755281 RepID=A0AA38HN04_9CUCU|nr:hypothetical protein Zmor_027270 [Zophobas morio]
MPVNKATLLLATAHCNRALWYLILFLSVCKPINSAIFENVSLILKWHSHMEDKEIVRISYDDYLRSYVGEFGEVVIQNQNIPVLGKLSVSNLPKVTHLYLTNCRIRKIQVGSFQNLPVLTDLNLSDNLLEEIDNGIFDKLSFKSLYLEGNRIVRIGDRAFNNLHMEYLFIDNNRIFEWKSEWFRGTPLGSVSITNNRLENLPGLAFEYLWHFGKDVVLVNFIASSNKIAKIDPDAFKGVKMIVTLNLQNNSLTHLEPGLFDTVENIDQIDLGQNKLSQIYYEVFRKTKITNLNVYDNFLTCVSTDIFATSELKVLNVRNNPISCPCVRKWSVWKVKSRFPEITNFGNLKTRCVKSVSAATQPIQLYILLFFILFHSCKIK